MDWKKIEEEYITTDITYKQLSEKYEIDLHILKIKGRSGEWFSKKKQYFNEKGMKIKGFSNLITVRERTEEEASAMSIKGGINSGKSRRSAKSARECMNALLELEIKDEKIRKSLEQFGVNTEDLQNKMLLMFQLMKNGIKTGDAGTIKSILEIAGEMTVKQEETNPVININVSEARTEDIE